MLPHVSSIHVHCLSHLDHARCTRLSQWHRHNPAGSVLRSSTSICAKIWICRHSLAHDASTGLLIAIFRTGCLQYAIICESFVGVCESFVCRAILIGLLYCLIWYVHVPAFFSTARPLLNRCVPCQYNASITTNDTTLSAAGATDPDMLPIEDPESPPLFGRLFEPELEQSDDKVDPEMPPLEPSVGIWRIFTSVFWDSTQLLVPAGQTTPSRVIRCSYEPQRQVVVMQHNI